VTLVDAGTLQTRSTLPVVTRGAVAGLGFEPRTGLLLAGSGHGLLAFIDPRTGTIVRRERAGMRLTPGFSADERRMATVDSDGTVRLWTLRAGLPAGTPRRYYPPGDAAEVALSPDGRTLAVASGLDVQLVDVATLKPRLTLAGTSGVLHARFTPDGRSVVGGSIDGWARLWSATTGRPVTRVFRGHTGAVFWESISPNGRTLATGSDDGTIQLFDLQSQRALGAPLTGIPNRTVAPLFTPDGAALFAVTNAGRGYRWDIRPSSWERHACAVAGRTLTRAEWDDALPGRPYAPAC
jgi:WD40 repeat protein